MLKIKRKKKTPEIRTLTEKERVRALEDRTRSWVGKHILQAYDDGGLKAAIKMAKDRISHSGSAGGGFWVTGTPKGIEVKIHDNRILVAFQQLSYEEVVKYLVDKRLYTEGVKETCKSKRKPKLKIKRKKK